MAKIHPADAETMRILELQKNNADVTRRRDGILIIITALFIAVFAVLVWLLPHKPFSEDENRTLQEFPKFSLEALTEGEYTADIGSFYSDQFPARRFFVGLKSVAELGQLKMQNNSVIPASGGRLVKRLEYESLDAAKKNLDAIKDFEELLTSKEIPVTTVIAPRSTDIFADFVHPIYSRDRTDKIWSLINESGLSDLSLVEPLKKAENDGGYVWYKTDHHWTTDGAYLAYTLLADELNYSPLPPEFFKPTTVSEEFYGTTWSSSGMPWTAPDEMKLYRFEGDEAYVVENMITGDVMQGFYDNSKLEVKDKYSTFLGGNQAYVKVYDPTATVEKPKLLIVKDSFAHSLAPFLAIHYELHIVDLRYYTESTAKLALSIDADRVLILVGADTLATSTDLTLLRYGLGSIE